MAKEFVSVLMFEGKAEEAMNFYASVFKEVHVDPIERYGADVPNMQGKVKRARLRLGEHEVVCFDSPIHQDFALTPAYSIWVDCWSETELAAAIEKLSKDGQILMPLGSYGFSKKFIWINDRFGVSWRLNLPR